MTLQEILDYLERYESLRDGCLDVSTMHELATIAKEQAIKIAEITVFIETLGDMGLRYVPNALVSIATYLKA